MMILIRFWKLFCTSTIRVKSDMGCRVNNMGDQKDISDMSFEEFFSESKTKKEREENRKVSAQSSHKEKLKSGRGFVGAIPKINFNNGKFLLYVPRYEGLENDHFNVAVEYGETVVPMDRLESVKQKGSRVTRPATIDLTSANVTPMDDFTVTIDGEKAFINKARPVVFYNSVGSPVLRPIGEVTAVTKSTVQAKPFKAEIIDSYTKNGLTVYNVNVLVSGTLTVDENASPVEDEPDVEPVVETPVEEEKPKKKAVKKVTVKGGFTLSQPNQDADIEYEGEKLPLYAEYPVMSVDIKGCTPEECTARVVGKDGEILNTSAALQFRVNTGDYVGPATVSLEKGNKVLATSKYFIIPDFECEYSGKGDITDDTVVKYRLCGEEGSRDVSEEDPYTFTVNGMEFKVIWCVPVITFDIGDGPRPFEVTDVDILDIKGETMNVTVRGARKKSLFFGGSSGKKKDVTPDWEGDSYFVDLAPIREEVFASPASNHYLYITVNSFPSRKFMTIMNPVRIKAKFEDGMIVSEIDPNIKGCVCRLYKIDKSVEEVNISQDSPNIPVADDVIEAEVVELHNGQVRSSVAVPVRSMPFLHRDGMGDKWMYVSKSKRIPLPDDLFVDGQPNIPAIKAWHERIVRMNPELKGVTFEMIQKAFKDFS